MELSLSINWNIRFHQTLQNEKDNEVKIYAEHLELVC